MFVLVESLRAAGESIAAHALRSVLTTFGVVVGVASVIAVVALMQGLQAAVEEEFAGLGGNSLSIFAQTPFEDRVQRRKPKPLTPENLHQIAGRVEGIAHITPLAVTRDEARHGSQSAVVPVRGTTHAFPHVYNAYERSGRFLSVADNRDRRRVCVIGEKTRESLGLPEDPIGEYIALGGEWLKVVGVMERKGELFGLSQDDHITIPYRTMRSMSPAHQAPELIIQVAVASGVPLDAASERIRRVLRQARGIEPGEPDDFAVRSAKEIADSFDDVIASVTAFVGGVVGISLLVGGVGIMNMMLVSVTERTREIGICKALGASRRHILLQFLVESLALSTLGGLIGLFAGLGLGVFAGSLIPDFPGVAVPAWAVALAIGFSALVGVLFGSLPASKAANMRPIEALRHE